MNSGIESFYHLLFNQDEQVCWSTNIYGTTVSTQEEFFSTRWWEEFQFFSINPLKQSRADANCTALRNILIEFDQIPLDEQHQYIINSGVPYSTCVFSGGKSYHFIIALEETLPSLEEYKRITKLVYAKLPSIDKANSNPSRFSRAPGAMRDGVEQALIDVKYRVPNQVLFDWIGPQAVLEHAQTHKPEDIRRFKVLNGFTQHFLMFGAAEGERNSKLFKAACDMLRAGYTPDEVFDRVIGSIDLDRREIIATIKSALKAVNNQLKAE